MGRWRQLWILCDKRRRGGWMQAGCRPSSVAKPKKTLGGRRKHSSRRRVAFYETVRSDYFLPILVWNSFDDTANSIHHHRHRTGLGTEGVLSVICLCHVWLVFRICRRRLVNAQSQFPLPSPNNLSRGYGGYGEKSLPDSRSPLPLAHSAPPFCRAKSV